MLYAGVHEGPKKRRKKKEAEEEEEEEVEEEKILCARGRADVTEL